ncbi:unnamed protein product [Arabidopsis arenosa]|uniref:Protein FAR1-RELATED SEQUENCE n=1 Tax=Arabidopsis arenosa TaxID=38785 RepID=A0A8S2AR77_ARAAE|nr:unnamed protein product [Arabidopsis arenosa]
MPSGECSNVQLDDDRISLEIDEGREFESKEEAFEFYKEYAKSVGFTTIIKASRRSRMTGKFIDAKFVCTRYGSKKQRRRYRYWFRQDGRWVIRGLIKEHNHEIFTGQANSLRDLGGRRKLEKLNGAIVKEVKSRKLLALEDEDVERLLNFFTDMQVENPFFFYAIDLSEEQSLRNVFWVDAKAMHGCQPRVILTKHDQMLKEAVLEVFPSSRHCFYMWDTLGQMPEKLGHVMRQEKNFMDEMNDAIYGSCKSEDFEKNWWEVVDRFHMRDNAWLQSLYEDREYWVPVYMKDVSLAGLCTAQRSDSVNSVFDKYIQRKTTLKAFLDQYKKMIQERYEEEEKAEIETLYKQPGLKSPSPFGKQMAEVYTREILKKFQVEVLGGVACHPKKESEEDGVNKRTFRVQDYEQNRAFVVVWNSELSEVVCSCRLFEFKGFLCRHAMIVLQMSGELSIPSQYVLKRWTKDAKSREAMESDQIDVESTKAQRYTDLCLRSLKLSEEASLSEESYNAMINVLNEALRKWENRSNLIQNVEESESVTAQDLPIHEEQNNTYEMNKDDNVADTGQEYSLQEVWKVTSLQEQRNRYSILDDYLSAQHMSHEMGHINSMASNRNGYCTVHQNIHSLGQSITQQRLYGNEQSSFRPEAMYERLEDMNEYKLPLVAFTGVNHHGQFLLLGCGLISTGESKYGFVWLFRAWLKAMHGCQPRVILTKHDRSLKEAVLEVFPSSRHCFYMWDTLGQMPEKLGHVMRQEKNFMDEMNDAIYGSCKSKDFEKNWWEIVDRFHMRDNAWLQSLYEDREYWVPVYMKDVSLAGLCTAQRSDSVNSVFDKYIQRKTTLKAFLDQYKKMIQERYEEEEKAEIETLYKQPGLKSPSPFGKQMAEVYTREMFKKFQVEVLGGVACHPKRESEEDGVRTFRVQDYEQNRAFVVVWNSESSEVVCSCRLFEFKGFHCRHAMIVLQMSGELSIPSQYVLKRWAKDAKSREVMESDLIDVD